MPESQTRTTQYLRNTVEHGNEYEWKAALIDLACNDGQMDGHILCDAIILTAPETLQ